MGLDVPLELAEQADLDDVERELRKLRREGWRPEESRGQHERLVRVATLLLEAVKAARPLPEAYAAIPRAAVRDDVDSFLECGAVVFNPGGLISASGLHRLYREWTVSAGLTAKTSTAFGRALVVKGLVKKKLAPGYFYVGIEAPCSP